MVCCKFVTLGTKQCKHQITDIVHFGDVFQLEGPLKRIHIEKHYFARMLIFMQKDKLASKGKKKPKQI